MSQKVDIRKISNIIFILTLIFLIFWSQRSSITPEGMDIHEATRYVMAMDTVVKLTAYGENADEAISDAVSKLGYLDDLMNANFEGSDVFKISNSNNEKIQISEETYKVIGTALKYADLTGGKFDISVRPLIELWGFGQEYPHIPLPKDIEKQKELVGYINIELSDDCYICMADGMKIDLGAIAKGYAADEMAKIFEEHEIFGGIIDLGGNILTVGENPKNFDGTWRIGVADPFEEGAVALYVDVLATSVVTSGDYQRYFEENGERYHHIIDPSTGYPVITDLRSATIVTASSIDADALSTCVFILGAEEGLKLVESIPDTEAILITSDKRILITPGLEAKIDVLNSSYSLIF